MISKWLFTLKYLSGGVRKNLLHIADFLEFFCQFLDLGFVLVFDYAFFEGGIVLYQDAGLGHMCAGTNFCIVLLVLYIK